MSLLSNLSITRKLLLIFGIMLGVVFSISAINYSKLSFIEDGHHWAAHTHRVLEQSGRVGRAMVDQETGIRGYLLSGETAFLAPYKAGRVDYDRALADLRALTADNRQQQARSVATDVLGEADTLSQEAQSLDQAVSRFLDSIRPSSVRSSVMGA